MLFIDGKEVEQLTEDKNHQWKCVFVVGVQLQCEDDEKRSWLGRSAYDDTRSYKGVTAEEVQQWISGAAALDVEGFFFDGMVAVGLNVETESTNSSQ